MEAFAYVLFIIVIVGPVLAYGIYTSLRGEPRRPDKPRKGKAASKAGSATS